MSFPPVGARQVRRLEAEQHRVLDPGRDLHPERATDWARARLAHAEQAVVVDRVPRRRAGHPDGRQDRVQPVARHRASHLPGRGPHAPEGLAPDARPEVADRRALERCAIAARLAPDRPLPEVEALEPEPALEQEHRVHRHVDPGVGGRPGGEGLGLPQRPAAGHVGRPLEQRQARVRLGAPRAVPEHAHASVAGDGEEPKRVRVDLDRGRHRVDAGDLDVERGRDHELRGPAVLVAVREHVRILELGAGDRFGARGVRQAAARRERGHREQWQDARGGSPRCEDA